MNEAVTIPKEEYLRLKNKEKETDSALENIESIEKNLHELKIMLNNKGNYKASQQELKLLRERRSEEILYGKEKKEMEELLEL